MVQDTHRVGLIEPDAMSMDRRGGGRRGRSGVGDAGSVSARAVEVNSAVACQAERMDEEEPDETVEVPIEDSLDLHSFPPREIVPVVRAYLDAAVERGFHEVRL